jgi:hypothetical protein
MNQIVNFKKLLGVCTLGLALTGTMQSWAGRPDLVINRSLLRTSVIVERQSFHSSDCDYVEGCLTTAGLRKLLKVDVGLANVGKSDLVIGSPEGRPDLFVWSPCHQHYHMKTMVKYRLLNMNYYPVTKGRKQAFCLRDNYPYTGTAGPSSGYNCNYQGITAGWQDVYDKSLACQYVDITGVAPGRYLLEVTVNPLQVFAETTYDNNKVIVAVTVPYLNHQ